MVKILFLCHGNICRSPMAEYILKDMAVRAGVADRFEIDSAAVSREEIGNPVYPAARRELGRRFLRRSHRPAGDRRGLAAFRPDLLYG